MDRRSFVKLMSILSGSALASCSAKVPKKLIPYLVPPGDGVIPGVARMVNTTCMECPAGCGMSVRVCDGRAVKLEGNPQHPDNRGALCIRGQAALDRLSLPGRLKEPAERGTGGSLSPVGFDAALDKVVEAVRAASAQGRRNVILAGRTTGTLDRVLDELAVAGGFERVPELELFHWTELRRASALVFGQHAVPAFDVAKADFLLTLGADVLETFGNPVAFARGVADRVESLSWYHVEPHVSISGSTASKRFVCGPEGMAWLLAWLVHNVRPVSAIPERIEALVPAPTVEETASRLGAHPDELRGLLDAIARSKAPLVIAGALAVTRAPWPVRGGSSVAGGAWPAKQPAPSGVGGGALAPSEVTGPVGLNAVLAALLQWKLGMAGAAPTVSQADGKRGSSGGQCLDFGRAWSLEHLGSPADAERLAEDVRNDRIGVLLVSRCYAFDRVPGLAEACAGGGATLVALAETDGGYARHAKLLLPVADPLESWGDVVPRGGLRSLVQPVVAPPAEARSEGEILLALKAKLGAASDDIPPALDAKLGAASLGTPWGRRLLAEWGDSAGELLRTGVAETPGHYTDLRMDEEGLARALSGVELPEIPAGPVLVLAPSLRAFDGRSADLPLMSEIPDPVSAVTWEDCVRVSEVDAQDLGLEDGDEVEIALADGGDGSPSEARTPSPGEAGDSPASGGGETGTGARGTGAGLVLPVRVQPGLPVGAFLVDVHAAAASLATADPGVKPAEAQQREPRRDGTIPSWGPRWDGTIPSWALSGGVVSGVRVRPTGTRRKIPVLSGSMREAEERGVLPGNGRGEHGGQGQGKGEVPRSAQDDGAVHGKHGPDQGQAVVAHPTLFSAHEHPEYRWGMAIDLDRCNGCSACVAACYVENNVPVTGLKEHLRGREMSWIRLEPFLGGQGPGPGVGEREGGNTGRGRDRPIEFLPMLCQHCDHAPCETVCPVYATYHNPEGLNAQVYNRCVGTRYCSNNCPYKVRRFNWFDHEKELVATGRANPDVSVRPVGVMEKCTFCVQRIREAKAGGPPPVEGKADGPPPPAKPGTPPRAGEGKGSDVGIGADLGVVPACAQTCPARAIVFGNLADPESEVSKLARSDRAWRVLDELGTRPAVTYLRRRPS